MGKRKNRVAGVAAMSLAAAASLASAQGAQADEVCVDQCVGTPIVFPSEARQDNFFKYSEAESFPGQSFDSYFKATQNAFVKLSDSPGSPDNALIKFLQKIQPIGTDG
jgi:cobalamin biosynthesis protein CbiD